MLKSHWTTLRPLLVALAAFFLVAGGKIEAAAGPGGSAASRRQDRPTEILFQGFTWDAAVGGQKGIWYRHLQTLVDDLAGLGITHMWFPPPSQSVAPQGYMPGDWYNLGEGDGEGRTLYGNVGELKGCLQAFKARGIQCLADIVINHRCASHQEAGIWNVFHHASGKATWEKWALSTNDYGGTGRADTGDDFGAAPDIDHTQPKVREDIVAWLSWLKNDIGFDGWRFDYTKGYGAAFVKEYVARTSPSFSVGEYWTSMGYDGSQMQSNQDAHRQRIVDWIDATAGGASSFDFTTKGLLQEALRTGEFWRLKDREGKAAGLIGWWPQRAVTFVDNHDTGSTQAHWPFPKDKVLAGYAYILTHPGVPTIFWDHYLAWGPQVHDALRTLAQVRHDAGLHAGSRLEILEATQGRYAARIDGKVAMTLGGPGWAPGAGWVLKASGDGWAVWTKAE